MNQGRLSKVNGAIGVFRDMNTKVVRNIPLIGENEIRLKRENKRRDRVGRAREEKTIINKYQENEVRLDEATTVN